MDDSIVGSFTMFLREQATIRLTWCFLLVPQSIVRRIDIEKY